MLIALRLNKGNSFIFLFCLWIWCSHWTQLHNVKIYHDKLVSAILSVEFPKNIDLSEIVQFVKADIIVIWVCTLSFQPSLRSVTFCVLMEVKPGFRDQKKCSFPLSRGVPSIEVTDTKITVHVNIFFLGQILCSLNKGVPKEMFHCTFTKSGQKLKNWSSVHVWTGSQRAKRFENHLHAKRYFHTYLKNFFQFWTLS